MPAELSVRLILLLPLAGAVFCGIVGLFLPGLRKNEALIGYTATAMVAIPFLLTVLLFAGFHGEAVVTTFYRWMAAGDLSIDFAYRIDQLSLLMTLIVTGIGALIHLYSVGYMHGDEGYWRFFAYLNLFIFAMLNLVLADNLVVLFLGWEGVGLCSYLLIGFWYEDLKNSAAATKAFVVNRVGDFAFLMAMFILFKNLGGLDYETILTFGRGLADGVIPGWVNWVVLLLFLGATGKSAQIPLFVWLPDAMAGPTPVSALIHAATMVTSGLYLLARLSPLVLAAPTMMATVAIVGALTSIMAASIAMTQNDIKKVLAYSTVSQLGYMFMAAGVGAFFVAIFHVMTHAFFKACLFLGSGSVIHAMHHVEHELEHAHGHDAHRAGTPHDDEAETNPFKHPLPYDGPFDAQDMRTMGGLAKYMPATNITFLISTLAIAGIPLLSGFFSKDEILFKAFEFGYEGHGYAWLVWGVGIVTAFMTAVYMTRCYVLTFKGEERWPEADRVHPHESPWTMTVPLWVLAALAAVGGFLGLPAVLLHLFGMEHSWIHHWLTGENGSPVAEPTVHGAGHAVPVAVEWGLLLLGSVIAIVGVLYAWRSYTKGGLAFDASVRAKWGSLYRRASDKYNWDEFYQRTIRGPLLGRIAPGMARFDAGVVDGTVNGIASVTRGSSNRLRWIQSGVVQNYAIAFVLGVALVVALVLFA